MNNLDSKLNLELNQRREQNLYRSRRISESATGIETQINGKSFLSFCNNDYLGLANHSDIKNALITGTQQWGVGSGAAHLITGHTAAHHALEEELAEFTNRPRALLFSTGYMANLGIASALLNHGDIVLEDRLNHASLIDAGLLSGARLSRYKHADINDLKKKLEFKKEGFKLVVTDSVFSMDGDIAPLKSIADTCQKNNACLMVDDAHGMGVLGEKGHGTLAHLNISDEQAPILMGTLGKAFGTFGAFIAGSETLIETLIQKARTYIYTTALPPALAEATRTSLNIVQNETWRRDHLFDLINYFRHHAFKLGLPLSNSETPIQPLILKSTEKANFVSQYLFEQGILVSAIRPPTVPKNTSRLRITFSTQHTEKHIDQLLLLLDKAMDNSS